MQKSISCFSKDFTHFLCLWCFFNLLIILPSVFFPCFIFNFASLERFRTRLRNLCTKNKIMMKLRLSWVNSAYLGLKLIGLTLLIQNINLEGLLERERQSLPISVWYQKMYSAEYQCKDKSLPLIHVSLIYVSYITATLVSLGHFIGMKMHLETVL